MKRARHSISFQIACLNEAIPAARDGTREGLEDAQHSLRRVQDQLHLLRMLADLKSNDPELFKALYCLVTEFPGGTLSDVRSIGL